MTHRTTRLVQLAAALALAGVATAASAVTEIQWWHSMTGALNTKVDEIADKFNASQKRLQGRAGLQGPVRRVDGRGDRRLSRRQPAADRAGVRSGHGDDDGRQGRGQAGVPDDGRSGREVRPEGVPRRGLRLLRGHAGTPDLDAVQQLDAGALHQQRRVQEGGPRPEEPAEDVARDGHRDGKAEGLRLELRVHHRLAVVGAARKLQRVAQRARSAPRKTASAGSTRGSCSTVRCRSSTSRT